MNARKAKQILLKILKAHGRRFLSCIAASLLLFSLSAHVNDTWVTMDANGQPEVQLYFF